jgi:hypothetical protein
MTMARISVTLLGRKDSPQGLRILFQLEMAMPEEGGTPPAQAEADLVYMPQPVEPGMPSPSFQQNPLPAVHTVSQSHRHDCRFLTRALSTTKAKLSMADATRHLAWN